MIAGTIFQNFGATLMVLAAVDSAAQTVRVTAWDVAAAESSQSSEIRQQLKALAPDVILLRGVSGWKMSARIAQELRPGRYNVAACSAFGENPKSETNHQQIAILARKTPYFSWSEPWKIRDSSAGTGGLTFAAIEIAGHRFGFLCVNLSQSDSADASAAQQWLAILNSFRNWSDNRLEGFVAATFRPIAKEGEIGRMLHSVGFVEVPASPGTSIGDKTVEAHLVPSVDSPRGLWLSKALITCDFDFHPAPIVLIVTNSPAPGAIQSTPVQVNSATAGAQPAFWWIGGALSFILLAIVTMLLSIRRRLGRLQAQSALVPIGGYNVVVASPISGDTTALADGSSVIPSLPVPGERHETAFRHGLFVHFAQWLKQAFVQRLINDRQKLLADQQVAVRKVSSVDERLARLETKIQQQTAAYEKEIELLNQKLLTAREENLELIRSQIKFLKSEMETTRERVLESEAT